MNTDTCDSCTDTKETNIYSLGSELFVWCESCADESATISNFAAIETRAEFIAWLSKNMPEASLHELDGEIIIHTGLEVTMGDYLSPIGEE